MESENETKSQLNKLPACAKEYISQVLEKMRYRRKVTQDVQAELAAHFEDELRDYATDEEKEQKAQQLIAEFGDVKLLAVLLRRAKKRCRPLWRKALVRSFQALGIIILYFLICSIPLFIGKPTISVNYVDWLNELVQSGRAESDNARPYYEKATQLYVKMPEWLAKNPIRWQYDLNDVELNSLSDWLEDNQGAIEALRQGSRRSGYWSEYHSDETELSKDLVANAMEILPKFRRLAFTMRWQILYEAYNGDIGKALSDCVALTKFGGHLQGNGLLIEQLVGIAIEGIANSVTLALLDRVAVPADVLKNTQIELKKQFDTQKPVISMEAEKVFWYDAIQRTFTDDGQGGGRMLARGMAYVVTDDWKKNLWRFLSFNHPRRQEVVANVDKYFERYAQILAETPLQLSDETMDDKVWYEVNISPLILKLQTPAHNRINQLAWRLRTGREALLTVLAVLSYEKEKGRYPTSLDELVVAGFLKELPIDSYSDKPLVYKKTDDNFILYSFGPDFKDDGGVSGKDKKGRAKQWMDNGDTVFWPLPKVQSD